MRTTAELREGFLAFFEEKGHVRQPSASLIPRADDHTTLFINAGMQPLMPYFLKREEPPAPLVVNTQKVFRTVDIDDVGLNARTLTFFEMMGSWSFGRYFKEEAIAYATEFVQERLKFDWNQIWATVHAGDPELGLGPDEEAVALWEKIGLPAERITPLPSSENFWSVGGPGPCGPDSELFYDWGEEAGCGRPECAPGCECDRFLEFWNLVFMSYELHADGTLTPLPEQNIDTGLGLERAARIAQQVPSVYDTDGFQKIMSWVETESGVAYGDSPDATKAHRVLADHGRAMAFIVADGVAPSNEGRGYVLRRIIRRAVQHGLRIGLEAPFLAGLSDTIIEQMSDMYPEVAEHRDEIHRILSAEEERFAETLERGMKVFDDVLGPNGVTGDDAFMLQATYGFPLELTEELARERGRIVDVDRARELMEEHREISRAGLGADGGIVLPGNRKSRFVGYEKTEVLTAILEYAEVGDGEFQARLEESPFYPEGGGQVSDTGWIENEETGARAELVHATRLVGDDQVLTFRGEGFAAGQRVRAVVPWKHRFPTMANHTATHLLHKALQDVLGDHVRQAGSAVRPDKLRFDFTNPQALTSDERERVEKIVNEKVFENLPVRAFVTPIAEARNLGAMMLFGEKYGDEVRVIEIPGFSRELCGGTHVRWTAEIGPFAILSESSVGAGARRIEAVTSGEAFALLDARSRELEELRAELARARKEARKPKAAEAADFSIVDREDDILLVEAKALKGGELRALSDRLRKQEKAQGVIVGSVDDGRAYLVVNLDEALVGRGLDAAQLVRDLGGHIGGGGGGKPTLAEAGGRNPDGLREALEAGKQLIAAALK